jgi:hypothetical protein
MEFGSILKRRVRGMAVRILSTIEHRFGVDDIESLGDDDKFGITGSDLKVIRSEILNAAGDTTRSLTSEDGPSKPGTLSLSRDMIAALNRAELDIVRTSDDEEVPIFRVFGNFNMLYKIRKEIGTGIVYNKTYTCAGLDESTDSLLPFLDSAQIAGIKIADGEYREWRDAICGLYLEGLGNE